MAESASSQHSIQVDLPEPGKVAEYTLSPDMPVKFGFFVSEVLFSCDGKDLVLTGEHGGVVVFKDYQAMAQEGELPLFELHGGELVPGDIYLFAFSDTALEVETAAGPLPDRTEGVEIKDHSDAKGGLIHGGDEHSALDSVHVHDGVAHAGHGILTYSELFSDSHEELFLHHGDEAGYVPALFGAEHCVSTVGLASCSFADSFDPLDDALQQVTDFHHVL
ncbi:hypothetical protein BerOc1_00387 [Pseudodesulfovibrio hydrargyri]|uniref:Uncharacterized protein n=1 Tax=Pseudodesulfovibrio hydrargyri TaxID=2125990 RepID=A0A1J5NJU2_9BACT|nr:hypothetical protein [Pseudodesulfovibrio hydrargyri]OIQ51921.1 hypothetical protein BerOc1_00387 [Pseudodesulfovibrio hydrargyri]